MNSDLLETLGKGYIVDNYIAFVHKKNKEKALIVYVTDALKGICDNTSKPYGGTVMNKRFYEILVPEKEEKEQEPQEVINKFKIGLEKVAKWTYST